MRKKLFPIIYISVTLQSFVLAQVGINTTTPMALLDISASNPNSPTSTDGLLIPRMSVNPTSGNAQGMLIFNTSLNAFQYWDGSNWKGLSSGTGSGGYTSYYADTKSSSAITVTQAAASQTLIPGMSTNFSVANSAKISFTASLNFDSSSSAFSPLFIMTLTNTATNQTTEISRVSQSYLQDGTTDTYYSLMLVGASNLSAGSYTVQVYAYYTNCCSYTFSYQVGGASDVCSMITASYQ